MMDVMSVLIGLAICLFTAVILYFISVKSFQEKPYEEVLAEQQQFANSLLKSEKSHKDKDKKNKKPAPKKTKEKEKGKTPPQPQATAQSVDFEDKPHVEFEPDTEIIPEEPLVSLHDKEKKKDKKEKVKPILRNRDRDQVPAEPFDPDVDSLNHFTEHPPKDDVEMKAKEVHKSGKKNVKVNVEERDAVPVVEPPAVREVAFTVGTNTAPVNPAPAPQQQQPSTPKKQRKRNTNKTDSVETVDNGEELLLQVGGTEKLLLALRQLPLTPAELQTMIEVLLNRQQEESTMADSEWMEPSGRLDPIGELRKQLADKEKALQEELEEKQVYQNKLRSLGTEMTAERTRSAAARKQLEESLARQTNELQVLTARLQQQAEHHVAEVNGLRMSIQQAQKASQASEEHIRQLQRLQEEKNQYEARLAAAQQMQQELEDVLRHKNQQFEEILMHKEQQLMEHANQVAMLAAKLQELEQTRNGQNHEMQREAAQLREALQTALAQEAQSLHAARDAHMRLEDFERTKQLLEDHITKIEREQQTERNIMVQKEHEMRQELQRLSMEKQSLTVQLSNSSQTRQDDDAKLASLHEQLATERSQAASKHTESEKELERLRHDNQALSEQLAQAVQSQQEHRSELEVALKAKEEELESQRRKNNELRDKNYKAMDALAAAEKALVDFKKSAAAAPKAPPVAEIAKNLKSVLPDLVVEESATAASFADVVSRQVTLKIERVGDEERSKAHSRVQHYKTVLAQTEELLHQLQSRIEAEEATWKVKITEQESELLALRREKVFWMDQCQSQEKLLQDQQKKEQNGNSSDHSEKILSLQKDKDCLQQDLEKEKAAAADISKLLNQQREQLDSLTANLAEEKRAALALRQQLEHTKAQLAATKVGSLGFMVGWSNGGRSAAAVASATVRKNSIAVDSLSSDALPPPAQAVAAESTEVPTTNGNGTAESAHEEGASHLGS